MSNFILSQAAYNNFTTEELLSQAEASDNYLAMHLYQSINEEHEESVETVPDTLEDTVLHLVDKPEWVKVGDYWYLEGFNVDTHPEHHCVRIETIKNKSYMVIIEHGKCGETIHDQRIDGLAKAKEYAMKWALRYALRNELIVE